MKDQPFAETGRCTTTLHTACDTDTIGKEPDNGESSLVRQFTRQANPGALANPAEFCMVCERSG